MQKRLAVLLLLVSFLPVRAQVAGKDVDLTAIDGVKLKATYYPAEKPGPAILLLHMCGGSVPGRKTWDHLAPMLATAGFHVLTLDYRGYGESGDTPATKANDEAAKAQQAKWPFDIDAGYEYLLRQPGVDRNRTGAAGASCGVDNAVALAIRHPELKSLVWLSGGSDSAGIEYVRRAGSLPIFAAASDDDNDFVPYMRWLLSFSPNPQSRFVEFERAGHGTNMFAVEKGLEPAIVQWFGDTLGAAAMAHKTAMIRPKATPEQESWDAITAPDGAARARQSFDDSAGRRRNSVLFPRWAVDGLAEERQNSGKLWDAIQLLNLNVAAYPDSPFVYYRLADAYRQAGDRQLAARNCQLALQRLDKATTVSERTRDYIRRNVTRILADVSGAGGK